MGCIAPGVVRSCGGGRKAATLKTGRRMCVVAALDGSEQREEGKGKVDGEGEEGSKVSPNKPEVCERLYGVWSEKCKRIR